MEYHFEEIGVVLGGVRDHLQRAVMGNTEEVEGLSLDAFGEVVGHYVDVEERLECWVNAGKTHIVFPRPVDMDKVPTENDTGILRAMWFISSAVQAKRAHSPKNAPELVVVADVPERGL